MQYNVIHSEDPYLLARMTTDLQMNGMKPCSFVLENYWCHPWDDKMEWIWFGDNEIRYNEFSLANHPCWVGNPIRHELTTKNYTKVLAEILSQK